VTNAGWYAHQGIDFTRYRIRIDLGLRYDVFRFAVADQLGGNAGGLAAAGVLQPKANAVWSPWRRIPLALHASYGRGISSADARGIVQYPNGPKVSTTDFYQLGTSLRWKRLSFSNDLFLIDRSHQQVYVPDNGTIEFTGPSRSYGWEAKTSLKITRRLSFTAGLTQVSNAFYRGTSPRIYVDSAPHTVANSGLTLEGWKGIFASLRYRHISGYILNATDDTIPGPYNVIGVAHASGTDVLDLSFTKKLPKRFEFNFSVDNLTNKSYYETQNYFISRLSSDPAPVLRVHGTPGYPIGVMAGLTFRLD
jgi:outer membrane receptor protein involved in Fe transport